MSSACSCLSGPSGGWWSRRYSPCACEGVDWVSPSWSTSPQMHWSLLHFHPWRYSFFHHLLLPFFHYQKCLFEWRALGRALKWAQARAHMKQGEMVRMSGPICFFGPIIDTRAHKKRAGPGPDVAAGFGGDRSFICGLRGDWRSLSSLHLLPRPGDQRAHSGRDRGQDPVDIPSLSLSGIH